VYAPLAETLRSRWHALVTAPEREKPSLFRPSRDATLTRRKAGFRGIPTLTSQSPRRRAPAFPRSRGIRSFDVQHVIPDDRIMETPRTDLWRAHGTHQVYITEAHTEVLKPGPGLTFAAEVPDMHHYNGRGGRVLPLYASTDHSRPNLAPGLLELLGSRLGSPVAPEDLAAYIAGVTGHPAVTATFTDGIYAAPPRPTARWPMAAALPGVLHFATHARAGAPGWRRGQAAGAETDKRHGAQVGVRAVGPDLQPAQVDRHDPLAVAHHTALGVPPDVELGDHAGAVGPGPVPTSS
jgi:hypothetical protein